MVWFSWFMVFNTTFKNISVISWWSALLVEENGVPGESHDYFNIHNSAKILTANIPYSFLVFKREERGDTNSKPQCLRVWWRLGSHYWLIPSTFWCLSQARTWISNIICHCLCFTSYGERWLLNVHFFYIGGI